MCFVILIYLLRSEDTEAMIEMDHKGERKAKDRRVCVVLYVALEVHVLRIPWTVKRTNASIASQLLWV